MSHLTHLSQLLFDLTPRLRPCFRELFADAYHSTDQAPVRVRVRVRARVSVRVRLRVRVSVNG